MAEWSHSFGRVPIYIHRFDAECVMRPDPVIQFWDGESKTLFSGLTLIETGGHFDGFQVLYWPGAAGRSVLLVGDQPYVCADRRWVSFMYSYPNLIPLGSTAIHGIVASLAPHTFERLYGAFPDQVVNTDAKAGVLRSADRYLQRIGE